MSLSDKCLQNTLSFVSHGLKEKYTIPGYSMKALSDNRCLHLAQHIHDKCWTQTGITEPITMVVIQPYIEQMIRIIIVLTPQTKIGYLSFLTNVRVRCNLDIEYQHHPEDQSNIIAQWLVQSTKEELSPEIFSLSNSQIDEVYNEDYQHVMNSYIQCLHNSIIPDWPSSERIIMFTDYGVAYFLEEIHVVYDLLKKVNRLTGKPFSDTTYDDLSEKLKTLCLSLTYALDKLRAISWT